MLLLAAPRRVRFSAMVLPVAIRRWFVWWSYCYCNH